MQEDVAGKKEVKEEDAGRRKWNPLDLVMFDTSLSVLLDLCL
jgi:hypothetical protein